MEYVIRVQDKRVYEAVLVFLRTLGFSATEAPAEVPKTSEGKESLAVEDAHTLGLSAFEAGYDADEADISSWVVREPNPKYGK